MTSVDNLVKCPDGTKLWLLHLGFLEADTSWFIAGAGVSTRSNPNPPRQRRTLIQYGVLISHPKEGLILWETGAGENEPEQTWGPPLNDIFARISSPPDLELKPQVQKCGFELSDINLVILGHLHMDHAGGLKEFVGTQVPILVHELELKHALYAVATKHDNGAYLKKYLHSDLNWRSWRGATHEPAQGLMLRHMPGHTPGLAIMQVDLRQSGTWLITSDMYILRENYYDNAVQGWALRDHDDWRHSNDAMHSLATRTDATLIFGHDLETFEQFQTAPHAYT